MTAISVAILCMIVADLAHPGEADLASRATRRMERRIQKKEAKLVEYVDKTLHLGSADWISFKSFPEDFVIYRYCSDTLQSWINRFNINNDDISTLHHWHRLHYLNNGSMAYTPLAYLSDRPQYINLGSSWYVVKAYDVGPDKIITGIHIKDQYPSDNFEFVDVMNKSLRLSSRYTTVTLDEAGSHIVHSTDGTPLFSILPAHNTSFKYRDYTHLWIAVLLLVCGLLIMHNGLKSTKSMLITIIGILGARMMVVLLAERINPGNSFFSPSTYAYNRLFDSFAALIFNNLTVVLLAYSVFLARRDLYRRYIRLARWAKILCKVLSAAAVIGIAAYINFTLMTLIFNSNISLNIAAIAEISSYTLISYFSYALLFLSLLFSLQIAITACFNTAEYSVFTHRFLAFYVAFISIYTVGVVGHYGLRKETMNNMVWTDKISIDHDLALEMQLQAAESAIANDRIIAVLTFMQDGGEMIRARLMERYFFRRTDENYNVAVTTCRSLDPLIIDAYTPMVNCYAFYNNELGDYGVELSPGSNFYYLNNFSGLTSYLGVFGYYDYSTGQDARLFIEIDSKKSQSDAYSGGLEIPGRPTRQTLPSNYSYARYVAGRMVTSSGDYKHPSHIDFNEIPKGYSKHIDNGYVHFSNRFTNDEVVVMSRKCNSFFTYLISFSYFFIFFSGIILLLTRRTRKVRLIALARNSFRRKITVLLTSTLLFSLLCTGAGSIVFTLKRQRENNEEQMEEKIKIVQASLSEYSKYAMRYSDVATPQILEAMNKLAYNIQNDINLYDTHGRIIRTTNSELFEQCLMGSRIDDKAFNEIVNRQASRYINFDKIASNYYPVIYAPLFNGDSRMVAIISIPYLATGEVIRGSALSMIATIFNIYLLLLIASLLIGVTVSNSISRPLTEIKRKLDTLSIDGKKDHIRYKNKNDELGVVVEAYNKMVDDLEESTRRLAASERESAWKSMARQIAHEIKNPLTPMKISIQHLNRMKKMGVPDWDKRYDEISQALLEQIDVLAETASEFSSFAKMAVEEQQEWDVVEILRNETALYELREDIRLELDLQVETAVAVLRGKQLSRVFMNLLTNAYQAVEEAVENGACPDPCVRITALLDGNWIEIDFDDNGPGVSEEALGKLFTPDFTTKSSGNGLGLAISRSIMELAGGSIEYSPSPLGGARFTVRIPTVN